MVYDYENLLVIEVLFDLKLKEFRIWVIWKRFEIENVEMSFCLALRQHAAWVKSCSVT